MNEYIKSTTGKKKSWPAQAGFFDVRKKVFENKYELCSRSKNKFKKFHKNRTT